MGDVVQQDFIGRRRPSSEVMGTLDQPDLRENPCHLLGDDRAVGVDDHLGDGFAAQECPQDVVIKREPGKKPVIFAGHSLTVVSHG
jgi:hypothetical protein